MKKYLLGLFALALAIGLSSFTVKESAPKATFLAEFIFVGPNASSYLVDEASYWETIVSQPDCQGGTNPCKVRVKSQYSSITTPSQLAAELSQHSSLDEVVDIIANQKDF